jgi:branched-chain amino acid transport system substrate-binding protein
MRARWMPSRLARTAAVVAVALIGGACGSQVPRAEIEAAAGGAAVDGGGGTAIASGAPSASASQRGSTAPGEATPADAGTGGAATPGTPAGPATGGATPGGGSNTVDRSVIRLGHIGTYSGLLGALFSGGPSTVQAWAQYVNANGGLNGHPVEVLVADDGADPSRNLSLTREMVEEQGVVAFVGNIVPLSLSGSRTYLEERQIPIVGGDLGTEDWFSSPMFFPQGGALSGTIAGLARLAIERAGPRVALLYCAESAGCAFVKQVFPGAVQAHGGQYVYEAQISLAQPDFTAECLSLRSNNVDVVNVSADANAIRRVARSCVQQGVDVTYVGFGIALEDSLKEDPNLDGLVGASSTFPWMVTDVGGAVAYGEAMSTYAPDTVFSGTTAAVWSAGALMQAAGRNLPEGDVAPADILAGLYALQGETLDGLAPPLTFRLGEPAPKSPCYWEVAIAGEEFIAPNGLDILCD